MESIKNLKVNLEQKILESNRVVVIPHNNVDFDAIGSAIGISAIAKKMKKASCIIVDDPMYKIDRGVQIVIEEAKKDFTIINRDKYQQLSSSGDLFVLTDVNKFNLINLKEELSDPKRIVIIDHHNSDAQTVPAEETFIDTSVSSASEVVTKLILMNKIKISPEIANYLLAGIYLDTNKLSKMNQNTSPETMRVVAKLLEMGANLNRVIDLFAEDFISDRRVQDLVSRAKIYTYSLAIASALDEEEYTREELAKVADYLLKYKVDAAFAIGSIGDNFVQISARSREKVNAGLVMQQIEGGGNETSAATKLTDCSIEEATNRLVKIIKPPCYIK